MAQKIGYQDGISGLVGFLRKFPLVKYRAPAERPAQIEQWSWLEKLERTLRILKDTHDAAITEPPPQPPDDPPPPQSTTKRLAPMTHYTTSRADARYCVNYPGVTRQSDGTYLDEGGFRYDDRGLSLGGRSGKFVSVLKPADSMDGLEPCDGYEKDGRRFPPWPAESYEV